MVYGTVICIGDSLTNGARCELGRGYPVELELALYRRHGQNWNCVNAGVNGQVSIEVYKRAYGLFKGHTEAAEVILLVGTNDAKVQYQTPPERYAEHVEAILRCAQRWDKISYLCLIPDLNGFGAPDFCSQELIDKYNVQLQALAKKWGNRLVDLRGMDASKYADGVHLNNEGYKEMAARIVKVIEQHRAYNFGGVE